MGTMANSIPVYWKWILSSCWCQVHHAPAFYCPFLSLSPPWTSNQLQTTSDLGTWTSHLTCQQFKVTATKISIKNIRALFYILPSCICEKPRLVHCCARQADGTARRKLWSVELSAPCTLPQHSSVCTRTGRKAWSAKHSCSMSGICCLMSSSIKPSGRDESSKPVHQPRLLYSKSH